MLCAPMLRSSISKIESPSSSAVEECRSPSTSLVHVTVKSVGDDSASETLAMNWISLSMGYADPYDGSLISILGLVFPVLAMDCCFPASEHAVAKARTINVVINRMVSLERIMPFDQHTVQVDTLIAWENVQYEVSNRSRGIAVDHDDDCLTLFSFDF